MSNKFTVAACLDGMSPSTSELDEVFSALYANFIKYPTTNGGMQKWILCCNTIFIYTRYVCTLCTFGADFHAQSALVNKTYASELIWKFIKGPFVGWACCFRWDLCLCVHKPSFVCVPFTLRERERESRIS